MAKKFIVTATMDVGYKTTIMAENEDEAWQMAKDSDFGAWEKTDDGHDWTLENVYEEKQMEDELYYIDDKRIYNHKLIENDDYEPNKECTSCDVEYTCWDCEAEQIRERYPEARYTDHLEWIVPDGTK